MSECLIMRKKCGCVVAAMVDDEETKPKERRRFYASASDRGATIERMETHTVRTVLRRCECTEGR